jgi:hypothetical protein
MKFAEIFADSVQGRRYYGFMLGHGPSLTALPPESHSHLCTSQLHRLKFCQ